MYFYHMLFVFKHLFLHVSPKSPVLVLILCGSSLATSGQQVILNTRSERIVVYPDGSWRYYERGDSVLMHKNMTKEDVMLPEEKEGMLFEKPSINPAEDADISALANRFADRVSTETNEARRALTKAVEDKFDAEARLNQAQDNREFTEYGLDLAPQEAQSGWHTIRIVAEDAKANAAIEQLENLRAAIFKILEKQIHARGLAGGILKKTEPLMIFTDEPEAERKLRIS